MAYSYCHGGDIETFVSEFGAQPIDLSANINPFGVPEAVRTSMHIQLGGDASYFGKTVRKAAFGDPLRRVNRTDILATIDLMNAASVLALALCCAVRLTLQR